jgi:beta-glucanase (GH16 family)
MNTAPRKKLIGYFAIATTLALFSALTVEGPAKAASKITTYKLLWSDEFTGKKGATPNPKVWTPELGGLNSNGELEYYTKDAKNLALDGSGHLLITANRIADQSEIAISNDPAIERMLNACNACQFTSAKIKSAGKLMFQYGKLEIRMKVPPGDGTWPAFWMLGSELLKGIPWPDSGEIDILETKGSLPNTAFGPIHGPGLAGGAGGGFGSTFTSPTPLTSGFHTYAIEWKKNLIDFYVDDNLYFTAAASDSSTGTWVYTQPFFMILNLAMGGEFTGDLDPAMTKAQMSIDYIRYYSINGVGKVVKN